MSWIDNVLKSLFPSSRNEEVVEWKEQYQLEDLSKELEIKAPDLIAFTKDLINQESWFIKEFSLVALNTPQSQGVVLKSDRLTDYEFFKLFVHFIKQQLKDIHNIYSVSIKELRHSESVDQKNETIFIYLKPKMEMIDEHKMNQRFGQLSLSLMKQNDHRFSFKIQVNYYAGFQYSEPMKIKDLFEFLISH